MEIGCGNAGALVGISQRWRLAVGTDLVRPEQGDWKSAASVVLADAAGCFRRGSFDLVFFNPPYVPTEGVEDFAVDGGQDGLDVPLKFLREAVSVLKENGKILALLSSQNPLEKFLGEAARLGLKVRSVAEGRLFWETLTVYELVRS